MKTVLFNPTGGFLSATAVFLGKMVANYEITLREVNSNASASMLSGDNTNTDDDRVNLPTPVENNNGRRVILDTGFYGLDAANNPDYEIQLEIYQDGNQIGFDTDKGTLTGKGQTSLIFILLVKQ